MARKFFFLLLLASLFIALVSPGFALEKVNLGTPLKMYPPLYLPILVGEEHGFWKDNGLQLEWIPFAGGAPIVRALATGAIEFGMGGSDTPLSAAVRGLPLIMVAMVTSSVRANIFVRTDSPYRHVRDLKGKRIGVSVLGGGMHVQARVIAAAEGIEKDVRFVGAGGAPAMMAGLRAGAFEAMVTAWFTAAPLKVEGIIRDIALADDYLPQPWAGNVVYARKDFTRTRPDTVRKVTRALLQSIDFIRKDSRWSINKMKSFQEISEEAAKLMYDQLGYTTTGRLDRKAVENMRKLYIDYGFIPEKAPAVDDLFTNEFLPS